VSGKRKPSRSLAPLPPYLAGFRYFVDDALVAEDVADFADAGALRDRHLDPAAAVAVKGLEERPEEPGHDQGEKRGDDPERVPAQGAEHAAARAGAAVAGAARVRRPLRRQPLVGVHRGSSARLVPGVFGRGRGRGRHRLLGRLVPELLLRGAKR
jgi:hypothetical protein